MATNMFKLPAQLPSEYVEAIEDSMLTMEEHIESRSNGYVLEYKCKIFSIKLEMFS